MLIEERRRKILKWIMEEESITLYELEKRLGISTMTISRDLSVLEKKYQIKRVRGGVIKSENETPPVFEMQSSIRRKINYTEKMLIAKYAVDNFVDENEIIVLEGGTTVSSMVYSLSPINMKIITNGLTIIDYVANNLVNIEVICCGGVLYEREFTFVGPQAEAFFNDFRAHKCFFGADGLTIEDGATDWNVPEIGVKKAMLKCAKQRILLVDSSKLGRSSLVLAVSLEDIDIVVTDKNADQDILEKLRSHDIEIHIAE